MGRQTNAGASETAQHRQKSIVRQTCLKVSGGIVQALINKSHLVKGEDPVAEILKIARHLEKYALVEEPEDDPDFDEKKREAVLAELVGNTED